VSKFFVIGSQINRTECATADDAVTHAKQLIARNQGRPAKYGSDLETTPPLYVVQLVKIVELAAPPITVTDAE
jgi:hypothetical protein